MMPFASGLDALVVSSSAPTAWPGKTSASNKRAQETTALESCTAYQHHGTSLEHACHFYNPAASGFLLAQQQQQQTLLHHSHTSRATSGTASGNGELLYAEYKRLHPEEFPDSDHLNLHTHMTSANTVTAQEQQSGLLATERALHARQHLLQQQQLLTARMQQQRHPQQKNTTAGAAGDAAAAVVGCYRSTTTALYGTHRSTSSTYSQHRGPSVSSHSQVQASSYNQHTSSLHLQHHHPSAARLPPRPAPASSGHHYHPYNGAATGSFAPGHHFRASAGASIDHKLSMSSAATVMPAAVSVAGAPAASVAAALDCRAGRWSGAVAVLEQSYSLESGNAMDPGSLECDEELLCLEGCDVIPQGVLLGARCNDGVDEAFDLYEDSGSTHPDSEEGYTPEDMEADAGPAPSHHPLHLATRAAAVAPTHAAAARQSVALRVLGRVASLRKGSEVLTADPAVAEAAGAQSVRSRLLITEVSVYTECATSSLMALDQCNRLMAKMKLPGGVKYMPVEANSFVFKAATAWQFPAFVVCLGSSYLQRMLARLPQLAAAAMVCPGFEDYCTCLEPSACPAPKLTGDDALSTLATLRSIQFTCIFLATKVADQVHALSLLRFILTNLSHNGVVVSQQQAADVEARCLDALDWRLGPFFSEDENLTDDDHELWAAAMGHWDYGTSADPRPQGVC